MRRPCRNSLAVMADHPFLAEKLFKGSDPQVYPKPEEGRAPEQQKWQTPSCASPEPEEGGEFVQEERGYGSWGQGGEKVNDQPEHYPAQEEQSQRPPPQGYCQKESTQPFPLSGVPIHLGQPWDIEGGRKLPRFPESEEGQKAGSEDSRSREKRAFVHRYKKGQESSKNGSYPLKTLPAHTVPPTP